MPKHEGPDLLEDRDLPKYDYITFMEHMMNHNGQDGDGDGGGQGLVNGAS